MRVLDRLLGLETEYAIRFAPAPGCARPTNARIYDAYAQVIGTLVGTRPGRRDRELFVENGGVIHYETPPYAHEWGLVEGGTPECRSPSAALLYQRAQDALLARATPLVERELAEQGFAGELSLLKNCRDAEGHIYGAQENYEVELARGAALAAWRVGLVALAPLVIAASLLTWALVLVLIPLMIAVLIVVGLIWIVAKPRLRQFLRGPCLRGAERGLGLLERALWEVPVVLFLLLYRACAFRRVRRALTPFLVSRQVLTGAGTLVDDRFALAEKAVAVRLLCRRGLGKSLAIFDPGNLCKHLGFAVLGPASYLRLFRRRQRMQLGLSDSNMAQTAEYLKLATTCLVIDMAEAGALDAMPAIARPVKRARAIAFGDVAGALAIQRAYVAAARGFVRESEATSLEANEIVERWSAVLDAIERAPESLVGRIDWITKRTLLERAGATADERKKIDLKYHELGTGYFARLEAHGVAPALVSDDEIRDAQTQPPADTPARMRAHLMRDLAGTPKVTVSWDRIRIGGPVRGVVIQLRDPE